MDVINGTIQINYETKTVTIKLEDDSYVKDHYPVGIMHFLEENIEFKNKKNLYK